MNMLLRLLWTYMRAPKRPPCPLLGPCLTHFAVLPTDLDVFRHMNNGVYFSIMDLARVDMLIRSGLMKAIREGGFGLIVDAETIRFRRALKLFQKYAIETRVIGWDDKAFIVQQRFLRPSRRSGSTDAVAEAVIRARILSRGTGLASVELLRMFQAENTPRPVLPDWIARWNEQQSSLRTKPLSTELR